MLGFCCYLLVCFYFIHLFSFNTRSLYIILTGLKHTFTASLVRGFKAYTTVPGLFFVILMKGYVTEKLAHARKYLTSTHEDNEFDSRMHV